MEEQYDRRKDAQKEEGHLRSNLRAMFWHDMTLTSVDVDAERALGVRGSGLL